jgi:hypothetical protein
MELALNPSVQHVLVAPKKGRRRQNVPPLDIQPAIPPLSPNAEEKNMHPKPSLEEKAPEIALIQGHLTVSF